MALSLPSQSLITRAVELVSLHGSETPDEAVQRAVERLRDRLQRMKEANEILGRWRPNQAEPALEQLGFPRSTVARLVVPAEHGGYGFSPDELAELETAIAALAAPWLASHLQEEDNPNE